MINGCKINEFNDTGQILCEKNNSVKKITIS